jgi:hypothetical protein
VKLEIADVLIKILLNSQISENRSALTVLFENHVSYLQMIKTSLVKYRYNLTGFWSGF